MSILQGLIDKKKQEQRVQTNSDIANAMFPTEGHVNAAIRMQNNLDAGQLDPSQYRWNKDVNPWEMSRPHWTDMISTQEGLSPSQVAQLNSDYYKMNNLPDVMNTPKNIDLLIKAAENIHQKFNRLEGIIVKLIDQQKKMQIEQRGIVKSYQTLIDIITRLFKWDKNG